MNLLFYRGTKVGCDKSIIFEKFFCITLLMRLTSIHNY